MTDTDMLYMASLEKRNAELEAKVVELESKHFVECTIISQYDDELKEAKRLLKAAVEDLYCTSNCVVCMYVKDNNCPDDRENCGYKWRYADEALALIGEDGEQNG